MLFNIGARVEVIWRESNEKYNIVYAHAWFTATIIEYGARKYKVQYEGYDAKDNGIVDEQDIRYPLTVKPFGEGESPVIPQVGDTIEVNTSVKQKEPPGWFEASVKSVNHDNKTIKVEWKSPYFQAFKLNADIKWRKARLIIRGHGYTEVETKQVVTIEMSASESIPAAARAAYEHSRKEKRDQAYNIYMREDLENILSKELDEKIVDTIREGKTHPNVTLGIIQDEMNPAKRFSFGAEVHGLFATKAIKKNTILGLYAGVVRTVGELDDSVTLLNEADKVYSIDLQFSERWAGGDDNKLLVVDACEKKNMMSFINDYRVGSEAPEQKLAQAKARKKKSTDLQTQKESLRATATLKHKSYKEHPEKFYWVNRVQNAEFIEVILDNFPYIIVITTANIKAGQEILADYGDGFWRNFQYIVERKICLHEHVGKLQKELQERDETIIQMKKQLQEANARLDSKAMQEFKPLLGGSGILDRKCALLLDRKEKLQVTKSNKRPLEVSEKKVKIRIPRSSKKAKKCQDKPTIPARAAEETKHPQSTDDQPSKGEDYSQLEADWSINDLNAGGGPLLQIEGPSEFSNNTDGYFDFLGQGPVKEEVVNRKKGGMRLYHDVICISDSDDDE